MLQQAVDRLLALVDTDGDAPVGRIEVKSDAPSRMSRSRLKQLADVLTRVLAGMIVHDVIRDVTASWREALDTKR